MTVKVTVTVTVMLRQPWHLPVEAPAQAPAHQQVRCPHWRRAPGGHIQWLPLWMMTAPAAQVASGQCLWGLCACCSPTGPRVPSNRNDDCSHKICVFPFSSCAGVWRLGHKGG